MTVLPHLKSATSATSPICNTLLLLLLLLLLPLRPVVASWGLLTALVAPSLLGVFSLTASHP